MDEMITIEFDGAFYELSVEAVLRLEAEVNRAIRLNRLQSWGRHLGNRDEETGATDIEADAQVNRSGLGWTNLFQIAHTKLEASN